MTSVTPAPRKRNYRWIYFFLFLLIASLGAAVFMIRFNLSIQLTPEKLEKAEQLWKEKGPKDYRLTYVKQINEDPNSTQFIVTVRGDKVQDVLMDGVPLEPAARVFHSMDRQFDDIARFLDLDSKPGQKRTYTVARFDDAHGGLIQYVRRVMGTRERVQINYQLEPLAP